MMDFVKFHSPATHLRWEVHQEAAASQHGRVVQRI